MVLFLVVAVVFMYERHRRRNQTKKLSEEMDLRRNDGDDGGDTSSNSSQDCGIEWPLHQVDEDEDPPGGEDGSVSRDLGMEWPLHEEGEPPESVPVPPEPSLRFCANLTEISADLYQDMIHHINRRLKTRNSKTRRRGRSMLQKGT
jgi:hypothetical protein